MYANRNPMMHQPIFFLKPQTEASQGKQLMLSNIRACKEIVDTIKTTLGPMGQDKLIRVNNKTHITNDGASVMDLLNISHPAAMLLADISKSQDLEIGDGTTSVVIIAGELLECAREYIEEGVHPQLIISCYRKALRLALDYIRTISVDLSSADEKERKDIITQCAETALNSKLLSSHKKFFGEIAYKCVTRMCSGDHGILDRSLVGIKKVRGGSVLETQWIDGIAFVKCFSYAGFENAPKAFDDVHILLLNIELELKAEKENAEIRVDNVIDYQKMVDAEWQMLMTRLESIVSSGANVVLSRLAIGDIATQYLADRGLFCAGRVEKEDMQRTSTATNGRILTTLSDLDKSSLGVCSRFEEIQIGNERYNVFKGCPVDRVSTIILRGGAPQFIDEAERSLHDAIMVCCRAWQGTKVLGGGGAIEMEVQAYLYSKARLISGKGQLLMMAFAKALEVIPRTLAQNSGWNPTEIVMKLRNLHYDCTETNRWFGVDCSEDTESHVMDSVKNFVWEPLNAKLNCYSSAVEAVCSILSVDEMVKNPKSNPDPVPNRG